MPLNTRATQGRLRRPATAWAEVAAALADPRLAILTAVVNPSVEAALVAGFGRHELGVTVVRRCVDIIELLSAAPTGTTRAALVSADLRGLDREALDQLAGCGLAVVGLAADEAEERLLHQLGTDLVLAISASPEQVAGALRSAAAALPPPGQSARPVSSVSPHVVASQRPGEAEPAPVTGTVIAVWGPAGAPGRTTVAIGLADASARRQRSALLIDADCYGGCVAALTGMLDEAPGITAACRAANAGTLDVPKLVRYCSELSSDLRVLTGLTQAGRWPELRPAALEVVVALARRVADVTVIDCGFSLEDDDELSYDTLAPRRNAATLTTLRAADRIVAVTSADPVGLSRLVRELPRLAATLGEPLEALTASGRVVVVANRVRAGLLPGNPSREVTDALTRHAGIGPYALLPMDVAAADAAHGRGQLLSEAAVGSALQLAVSELTFRLIPDSSHRPAAAPMPSRSRRFSRPSATARKASLLSSPRRPR